MAAVRALCERPGQTSPAPSGGRTGLLHCCVWVRLGQYDIVNALWNVLFIRVYSFVTKLFRRSLIWCVGFAAFPCR